MTRTERPRASSRSVRWEPINPAPPVTRSSIVSITCLCATARHWGRRCHSNLSDAASFKEDEAPVALIAALPVNPFPVLHVVEGLAGQLPIEQVRALPFVPEGFDHDVFLGALADPIDLAHRVEEMPDRKIVQPSKRNHEVERLVRIGQGYRIADLKGRLHFLLRIGDGIVRYVDPGNLDTRNGGREPMQQQALPAAAR